MSLTGLAALSTDLSGVGRILSGISIAITVIAAAILILCGFIGFRRGLFRSLLRLGAIVLSVAAALGLTFALKGVLANLLSPVFSSLLGDSIPADLSPSGSALAILLAELPGALLAPILFGVLFFVCNVIFWIVYLIIKHIKVFDRTLISAKIGGKVKVDNLVSAAVGVVGALMLVIGFTIPLSGYLRLADNTITQIGALEGFDEELTATLNEVEDNIVSPLADNPVVVTSNALGGKALFNSTSAIRVNGRKIVWEKEIAYLINSYNTLKPLLDTEFDFSQFGEEQGAALRRFANDFDQSVLISSIAADVLPAAANAWKDGQTFAGIDNPMASVPELLKPMMDNTLDILATTTTDTLKTDLITVSEVLATLSESGAFAALSGNASAADILKALSQEGMISSLLDTLYDNERMQALVSDVANLGFNAIGETLNIPADDEEIYTDLINELNDEIRKTESLESYDEKLHTLSVGIENVFTKYGVETDTDEASLYAACILGIGPDYTAAAEVAVPSYFETISNALNETTVPSVNTGIVTTADAPKSVSELVSEYYAQKGTNALQQAKSLTEQLSGKTDLVHNTITLNALAVTAESIAALSKEDFSKQSQAIEKVLTTLIGVVEVDENDNITVDITKLDTASLSAALRDLSATRTDEAGNTVQNLATATTNLVKSSLQNSGIDAKAADNLVEHIASRPENANGTSDPLSSALSLVGVIRTENNTKDDFKSAVNNLVENLDTESAEVLADCVSPNLINQYTTKPLEPGRANALSASVKDLLTNFGEKSDTLTDEQLDAESTYLQTILTLSMSAQEEEAGTPLFGEKGASRLDMSAEEFVATVSNSVVISQTILEQQDNLKIAIANSMSAADKAALSEALANDNTLSKEMKAALNIAFALTAEAE